MNTDKTAAEVVRQATRQSHASTEKALINYVREIRTADDYVLLLNCLHGYFAPLENQIEPYLNTVLADYGERRKATKMQDDLKALEHAPFNNFSDDLPSITDHITALGCFYVMEGSVLGGGAIKKIVQSQSNEIPLSSFSFFSGYGDNTSEMWRSFIAQFNSHIHSDEQMELVNAAANECFQKLENWISEFYTAVRR
jgi:heme oxygenase (biliverdin-IX-beta and delta-forming)